MKKVMEPFLSDMKQLESYGLEIDGIKHVFSGTLSFVSDDNLDSHFLGGFPESFSPNVVIICIICLATSKPIQTTLNPNSFQRRDKCNYDNHVEQLKENPKKRYHICCKI